MLLTSLPPRRLNVPGQLRALMLARHENGNLPTTRLLGEVKVIESGLDLLDLVRLHDVQYFETSARLKAGFPLPGEASGVDQPEADDGRSEQAADSAEGVDEEGTRWQFLLQVAPESLNLRARLHQRASDASYVIDAAVFYEFEEAVELPVAVVEEFVNRAAMLALYPFVREALHEAARKIGADLPLLGIYKPGQLAVEITGPSRSA